MDSDIITIILSRFATETDNLTQSFSSKATQFISKFHKFLQQNRDVFANFIFNISSGTLIYPLLLLYLDSDILFTMFIDLISKTISEEVYFFVIIFNHLQLKMKQKNK
jgi:hypothetical protein